MADYGHVLRFGCFVPPEAARERALVRLAQQADAAGLEILAIQDHPYQPSFLDTWTLLSYLASETTDITLVPAVANLPLRPPGVLARSVASLDILSGGRVELGLGAGAFWDAIEGMGGPRRTPKQALGALGEAIEVLRALWDGRRDTDVDGEFYRLHGARPGPKPVHPVGIWLGVYGPRALRMTGRLADGWLGGASFAPVEKLADLMRGIDEGAREAGREPEAVRRIYVIDPAMTADDLTELALSQGISAFLLPVSPDGERAVVRFAGDVVPAVRAAVAAARGEALTAPPSADNPIDIMDRAVDAFGRPAAPLPTNVTHNPIGERTAKTLVAVHNQLRAELAQLQQAVAQVLAGRDDPASARSLINRMTMRQNYWSLGAFCSSYCRIVTGHHLLEDEVMYPELQAAEPDLAPVLTRLESEHHLIADLIDRLDKTLIVMVENPSWVDEVRRVLDKLAECLLSHLDYEEEQLLGPLSRHDIEV